MKSITLLKTARYVLTVIIACAPQFCLAQTAHDSRVDLGGYKLFVSDAGSGAPTVVFESGLGEDVETWLDVLPHVSQFTRTIAYDRAGLGKSDNSPHPRTVEQMASELHSLLSIAVVSPPYILVGHSLGGAIVQVFAHSYPTEVAGMVLVDPEDGRLINRLESRLSKDEWAKRQKALDGFMSKASATQKAELDNSKSSGKAVADAIPLPDVPTVLLTGTKKDPDFPGNPLEQDLKLELHNELLASLPRAKHVLAPESRHYIQNDSPKLVIDAILSIVDICRKAHAPTN